MVDSKWWDKFSWVGYCSVTAGVPLKAPIKTGIRVIGRAELWTVAVILCCSSIQKSQLQITLHKEKASPWPQKMTQVQQAICKRKEQRGSQLSNITQVRPELRFQTVSGFLYFGSVIICFHYEFNLSWLWNNFLCTSNNVYSMQNLYLMCNKNKHQNILKWEL